MIYGIKDDKSQIQALRYKLKDGWTAEAAKSHCKSRGGSFEAASGKGKNMDISYSKGKGPIRRVYSVMEVKAVDDEQRIIEGIATTPTPDRYEDVVETEGAEFTLPLPFLYQHNARQPIGNVIETSIKKDGMKIRAKLAGAGVADFIDEAWNLIKAKLVRGLSIGFRSLEESYDKVTGGYRFIRWELLEISAVTIPANQDANISAVKSASVNALTAISRGRETDRPKDKQINRSGVSDKIKKGKMKKTLAEQIADFEAKRAANDARMRELMGLAGDEGRTLTDVEAEEYDGLESEVKTIDEHLVRLRSLESQVVATATPVSVKSVETQAKAAEVRGGGVITVKKPELPKGIAFTRFAIALMRARGELGVAQNIAKQWKDTPEVELVLKAAVAAGTTTGTGWAAELADYTYMASEFIEYLRPMTIIGRIPGLRNVPFNIKLPLQDSGSTVAWVGEGSRKPVGKLNFDTTTLRFAKASGIVVLTEELVRFSNPSAEALVRDDLAGAMRQFLDEQFVDPTVAAVANVSPASITNGAGTSAASGTTSTALRTDFKTILAQFTAANLPTNGCVFIMLPDQATAIGLIQNALGQTEFPELTADGGKLFGYPVITSASVPSGVIVFCKPSEILLADDGGIEIDASREASLVMDDGGSPAVTTMVSLWQNNMVGLRADRTINWGRRRDAAVYYLTSCNYG